MNTLLFEILLSIVVFVVSLSLGFIIYLKNPRSATNKLFFLLSFLIDAYIIINYLSLHPPVNSIASQLFWIRMVMVTTSFIGPVTLLLVHTFPGSHISLRLRYLLPLGALAFASAAASATSLVFKSLTYINNSPIPAPGPAIPLFFLDFVGIFLVSFSVLLLRYRHQNGAQKIQYLYLLLGVVISFSLTSIFTVILVVIFQISSFVLLGSLSPVILMGFIAYAIVKHGLFDIKVVAAEAFTVLIWVILFAKVFIASSSGELSVDIFILALVIIFGIFLIRSVRKEVEQRERLQIITRQLEEANKDLRRLDQTKTEFMSIASHQLRAPLTVIKGYLSLALEGTLGVVPQSVKEPLGKAATAAEQLIKLMSDLLNLTRMEAGKINYAFVVNNISLIIKEVMEELKPQAEVKKITIRLEPKDDLEQFIFDRDKMREVIINLIHNAVKYTQKFGDILVRQQVVGRDGKEYTRISVKDDGMGIAPEDVHRLFVKFVRSAEAKTIDANGLGLGLFFVKKVVEDHGGKTWVESEGLGKGSTFFVEIPFKQ